MRITKAEVREMYRTMSTKEMMEALGGICASKLYKIIDEAGCDRKIKNRKPRNYFKIDLID
jgi:hypothetical protein